MPTKIYKIKENLLFLVKGMQHAALVTKTKMNTPIKRIVFTTKIVVYCNKLTKIILLSVKTKTVQN